MGITIPAGLEIVYNKTLRMYDISVFCNVGKNPRFFPRAKYYKLTEISYLFSIAQSWSNLTDQQRTDWATAGAVIGQHGYNLYVQDKSYRIKNEIGGDATPSTFHQYLVGHIKIESPATSAKIAQYNSYHVHFPADFEISYKTNLVADGPSPSVKMQFVWKRYTQGQNIEATEEIVIPLITDWAKQTKSVTELEGIHGEWKIYLELTDVTGDIWFDNVIVEYSGEIRNSDPYCFDVDKAWNNVNIGEGVTFETIYPT